MKKWYIIPIRGDGACLFNAVATGILKATINNYFSARDVSVLSKQLRLEVVDLIEKKSRQSKDYRNSIALTYLEESEPTRKIRRTDKGLKSNNKAAAATALVKFREPVSERVITNSITKYLQRMRRTCEWGGHIETMMLDKILRKNYKKYFPGGLMVYKYKTNRVRKTYNNSNSNNNDNNYNDNYNDEYYKSITERNVAQIQMTSAQTGTTKHQMSIILYDADRGGTHFELLWPTISNISMNRFG
jgi:hypothetical protein